MTRTLSHEAESVGVPAAAHFARKYYELACWAAQQLGIRASLAVFCPTQRDPIMVGGRALRLPVP